MWPILLSSCSWSPWLTFLFFSSVLFTLEKKNVLCQSGLFSEAPGDPGFLVSALFLRLLLPSLLSYAVPVPDSSQNPVRFDNVQSSIPGSPRPHLKFNSNIAQATNFSVYSPVEKK